MKRRFRLIKIAMRCGLVSLSFALAVAVLTNDWASLWFPIYWVMVVSIPIIVIDILFGD